MEDQVRPWAILGAGARWRRTDARELALAGDIVLEPLDGAPLRLRVVDTAGVPLGDHRITVRFPDFVLTPEHLALGRRAGLEMQAKTDVLGQVTLPFLDAASRLPAIEVAGMALPLTAPADGGRFEIVVP